MIGQTPNHIFVTGGSGFLGSRLVQRLVADGYRVSALARSAATAKILSGFGATIVEGDLLDIGSWQQQLEGVDAIVHSAAYLKFGDTRKRFQRINVEATRQLLAAARSVGVETFVFVSAASVVMQQPAAMEGVTEASALTRADWLPYSSTKAEAEQLVLAAARTASGMRAVAVRPPFIWGKGDAFDHDLGALIRAGRFAYFDSGRFPYSVCHVDNACEAVVAALVRGRSGEAYFVGDGEVTTAKEFFDQRIGALGLTPPRRGIPSRAAFRIARGLETVWPFGRLGYAPPINREIVRLMGWPFVLDISKAERDLGFRPIRSRAEGLQECGATIRP